MRRAVFLAVLVGLVACSAPPPLAGSIAGTVAVPDGTLDGVVVAIPGQVALPDATGAFTFATLSPGNYTVTATKDSYLPATAKVTVAPGKAATATLSLVRRNRAPVITSAVASPPVLARGGTSQLLVSASDPDGDTLSYTFTASDGWTVTAGDPGTATITAPTDPSATGSVVVTVDDGHTGSASATVPLTTSDNRAPVVASLTAVPSTLSPGGVATVSVSAADPDGDVLAYAWTVPDGWTVDGTGASVQVTAPTSYGASAVVKVEVTDGQGGVVDATTSLSTTANEAPVFSSLVAEPNPVAPGGTVQLTASAADPNGDALTFSWTISDGWTIEGDGASATVTAPLEYGSMAIAEVTADDGAGGTTKARVAISTPADESPVVRSVTALPPTVAPGGRVTVTALADDPDGDALTYQWTAPAGWTIDGDSDAASAVLVAPTSYAASGTASVIVSDGTLSATASVVVSTADDRAPLVASVLAQPAQVAPGGTVQVIVAATDPDGDALAYQWTAPEGWTIAGASDTADVSLLAPTQYAATGVASVTVSDGLRTTLANVIVSTTADRAPVMTSVLAQPAEVAPGGTIHVVAAATDPDGDALSYAWTVSDGWSVVGTGAEVDVQAPSGFGKTGTVAVTVSDGFGGTATGQAAVATRANQAPVIGFIVVDTNPLLRGASTTVTAYATDGDDDPLTYAWTAPSGWTLTGTGARVTLTAPATSSVDQSLEVTVTDGRGGTASKTVTVATYDRPPSIDTLAASNLTPLPLETVTLTATVSDPDGDDVTLDWASSNPDWTLSSEADAVTVTAPTANGTSTTITLTAKDALGAITTKTLDLAGASCGAGTMNCDGNGANGCEAVLATSAANCGACGHVCSGTTTACVDSSCVAPMGVRPLSGTESHELSAHKFSDVVTDSATGKLYVMNDYTGDSQVTEYPSFTAYLNGTGARTFSAPNSWEGTYHAAMGGYLYFDRDETNTLEKVRVSDGALIQSAPLTGAGFHNAAAFNWGGYSDIDLWSDTGGRLFVLYAPNTPANATLAELDPDTLAVKSSWTVPHPKGSMGWAFMAHGVLYVGFQYNIPRFDATFDTSTATWTTFSDSFTPAPSGEYIYAVSWSPFTNQLFELTGATLFVYDDAR